jgi:hypothetical protein
MASSSGDQREDRFFFSPAFAAACFSRSLRWRANTSSGDDCAADVVAVDVSPDNAKDHPGEDHGGGHAASHVPVSYSGDWYSLYEGGRLKLSRKRKRK